uniref:phosphatidate phosphatase n=1 Tax=Tabanus bromius TaxID=304241 RepID=A0A0K8TTZ6_TABBR
MNSLVRVFSNFKEFYSEINGATLTGAIDVIAVEQPDGTYLCSPFHVRFGKLGVLRSREKVVDIEVNGEPIDIHMKLGESGEAFFVEECPEDLEELPENLATSPIPTSELSKYEEHKNLNNASETVELPLPRPRRNSIDLSKECNEETTEKKFENQVSDFSHRRHTDNIIERRDLSVKKVEYTTQKIRQEWAEHEDQLFQLESLEKAKDWSNSTLKTEETKNEAEQNNVQSKTKEETKVAVKEESKSKKKRRKKSQMKKKYTQRKSSSSSSVGSVQLESNEQEPDTVSLSNQTNSSNDESSSKIDEVSSKSESKVEETVIEEKKKVNENNANANPEIVSPLSRIRDLDIHFFSDTEIASGLSPRCSRPSTPIQSDSELEITQREKDANNLMTNSASWKWGELPTQGEEIQDNPDQKQAQRNSMLSGMFSFMKRTNKLRKNATDGVYLSDLDAEGMDPEMAALYFPPINKDSSLLNNEDDRESGNGTSLPHSPSSIEGPKSLDSDYDDGKTSDKCLDFVAMSLCGGMEKGGPTDEEFDQHAMKYSEVCQNPSIFSSPNLVVRLNGKYYSWAAACPIVMTIITFQKPLSNDAIEKLTKQAQTPFEEESISKSDVMPNASAPTQEAKRGYSWWYWRRSGGEKQESKEDTKIDVDSSAVATQTSRPNSPENKENESAAVLTTDDNAEDKQNISNVPESLSVEKMTQSTLSKTEKYRKSLRLSSEQIKSLNLKHGMNEVTFSVTTAYQGTSRCKCYLFRWKHSDKVVISDIDGTITKSDVLGHILPMVGKDWAQIGVAQLFSKIEENGYKLLYLSARAIGQSRATREYLRSIRQGDVKLPDGPLLLNPTSLISALHREVIERKPEQFKIACLSDIQALFPNKNPFYAGYGNRINDVWAYRAVGIPIMRIFTINTKGELKHELTQTFQSSYTGQTLVVNELFPPYQAEIDSIDDEDYSDDFDDDDDDGVGLQFSQTDDDENNN